MLNNFIKMKFSHLKNIGTFHFYLSKHTLIKIPKTLNIFQSMIQMKTLGQWQAASFSSLSGLL